MGRQYYRRAGSAVAVSSPAGAATLPAPDGDPYADYLAWIADGRPALGGSALARPEAGTVSLADHVQVRDPGSLPELADLSGSGSGSSATRGTLWHRLTAPFRRAA